MSQRKSLDRFLLKKRGRAIGEIKLIRSGIEETGIKSTNGDQTGHDPLKKGSVTIGNIKLIRSRIEGTEIKSAKGDQIGYDPLSRIPSLDPVPPVRTWVHELPATSGDANDFEKL